MYKPEIETFQNPWELEQLVTLFDYQGPPKTLEVGAWHGGTLWHWLQGSETVVVVDDEMRRWQDWNRWADEAGADLTMFHGSSHAKATVDLARACGPYDFLFIDADHSYDSVRRDWENYSPMVREGGFIALHDILPREGYGVSVLWEQIKELPGTRWMEICHNEVLPGNGGRCGIGVVFV